MKLKPCPKCHNKKPLTLDIKGFGCVYCGKCEAHTGYEKNLKVAWMIWNKATRTKAGK